MHIQQTITIYIISHVQTPKHFIDSLIGTVNIFFMTVWAPQTVLCITVSLVPLRTSSMNGFEWVSEDEVVLWHSWLRYSGQLSGIFDVSMPLPWQQMQTKFLCPWFLTSLLQESEIHYIIAIHSLLYKLMQRHSIHRSSKCSFDCGFFVLIH